MNVPYVLHLSFCLIRVSSLYPEDIRTVSKAPLGFYEPLGHKFPVYVMTHAHWFTSGSHSGVGHLGCFMYTHESWKKRTHTHTGVQ